MGKTEVVLSKHKKNEISFGKLIKGDYFQHGYRVFIKVTACDVDSSDDSGILRWNAIRISGEKQGSRSIFSDNTPVVYLPKIILDNVSIS